MVHSFIGKQIQEPKALAHQQKDKTFSFLQKLLSFFRLLLRSAASLDVESSMHGVIVQKNIKDAKQSN